MLPNPLKNNAGQRIETSNTWLNERRKEILELFGEHVYGKTPRFIGTIHFDVYQEDDQALQGTATRKQITIRLVSGKNVRRLQLLLFLPHASKNKPAPIFCLLNFEGNHTVCQDPTIALPQSYLNPEWLPSEERRGKKAYRFPLKSILERGYGLATMYYGDVAPDHPEHFKEGIMSLFAPLPQSNENWGAVGAWAWGLSRIMDYLENDKQVDSTKVAVLGHSRLGKAALWAGAQDDRFSIVISNNSGCTGAALSRGKQGESIQAINDHFPHWFCENYKRYNGRESDLPIDQHMLLALIAPRPIYVASATDDLWADPQAEFRSCLEAESVYCLFGFNGVGMENLPAPNQLQMKGHIGYHIRSGKHELLAYDWNCFMDFVDRHRA